MNVAATPRRLAPGLLLAGAIIALGVVASFVGGAELFRPATIGVAFLAGAVTGSHCIGMCGGFVLCYASARGHSPRAHATYAAAKTISYSLIGAASGALGSAVSASGRWPGLAALAAGVFLLVLGAHLLGLRAWPQRFRFAAFDRAAHWLRERARRSASPLGIGLANGLMLGCGPLLAMYAAAAGTGSALEGAALLAAFGLGTLPVMLASAWIASTLLGNFQRSLARLSGPIVLGCGALMLQRGFVLATPAAAAATSVAAATSSDAVQVIRMRAGAHAWSPAHFVLKKGVPVKWIIDAREASVCTARLRAPALGLEVELGEGERVIEFTPRETGEIAWSCWMGMARGSFTVTDEAPPGRGDLPHAAPVTTTRPPQ